MNRSLGILLCAIAMAFGGMAAGAAGATIRCKDGKTYTGQIALADGSFSITASDGKAATVASADVASVDMQDAPAPATTRSAPATNPALEGGGLRGEYFAGRDFQEPPRFIRGDPTINFLFTEPNEPVPGPNPTVWQDMCVRWTGKLRPQVSDRYTFFVPGDCLTRIWIDHRLILDYFYWQTTPVQLEAGKDYDFRVECVARPRFKGAEVAWESPHVPRQVICSQCLFPPDGDGVVPPTPIISAPDDGTTLVGPIDVPLSVDIKPGSSSPVQVEYRDGPLSLGVVKSAPFDFVWPKAPIGDHEVTATVTNADGTTGVSAARHVVVGSDLQGALPKSWLTALVPLPAQPLPPTPSAPSEAAAAPTPPAQPAGAGVTVQNDLFTLHCTGGDVYTTSDSFRYVFRRLVGDGSIVVRVADVSGDQKGAHPLAGLMFRTTARADSPYVAILLVPSVGDVFLARHSPSGEAANSTTPGQGPIYFRLTRTGYTVRADRSSDGQKWEYLGETAVTIPPSMLVGIITCGGDAGVTATATFDHLAVSNAEATEAPPFQPQVVLSDGTRLVGGVVNVTKGFAFIHRAETPKRSRVKVARSALARVFFNPVSDDALAALTDQQTGVILNSGDFFEGQIEDLSPGRWTVDSVVFGPRAFGPGEVKALILGPVAKSAPVQADLTDGSTIASSSFSIGAEGIQLQGAAGDMTVPLNEIRQILVH